MTIYDLPSHETRTLEQLATAAAFALISNMMFVADAS